MSLMSLAADSYTERERERVVSGPGVLGLVLRTSPPTLFGVISKQHCLAVWSFSTQSNSTHHPRHSVDQQLATSAQQAIKNGRKQIQLSRHGGEGLDLHLAHGRPLWCMGCLVSVDPFGVEEWN